MAFLPVYPSSSDSSFFPPSSSLFELAPSTQATPAEMMSLIAGGREGEVTARTGNEQTAFKARMVAAVATSHDREVEV